MTKLGWLTLASALGLWACGGGGKGKGAGATKTSMPTKAEAPPPAACNTIEECTPPCEKGHAGSCIRLVVLLDMNHPHAAAYVPKLEAILTKSCGSGTMLVCTGLADVLCDHEEGTDEPADCRKRATMLHEVACAAGEGVACITLGQKVREDDEEAGMVFLDKAFEPLAKACEQGDLPLLCLIFAEVYQNDEDETRKQRVKTAFARAKQQYEKACQADDALACHGLASYYEKGLPGADADQTHAAEVMRNACALNDKLTGCQRE